MKKVGIALGGGGARGLAHIGVLKILERESIPISYIAGTSIGAIIGAMYAQTPDTNVLTQRFMSTLDEGFYSKLEKEFSSERQEDQTFFQKQTSNIKNRIALNLAPSREALIKNAKPQEILDKLILPGNIEQTKIPLNIVSTSLQTGKDVVFKRGDIIQAVLASSSVTGYLAPVHTTTDVLTDGAVSRPVPVKILKEMGADITIGVDICVREFDHLENINVVDSLNRAYNITMKRFSKLMAETSDIPIYPDTGTIHWSEFSAYQELIALGIRATIPVIPKLKKLMKKRRFLEKWEKHSLRELFIN